MGAIYEGYAGVYDALGQCGWGAALARFVLDEVVTGWEVEGATALDLACGTGAAGLVLSGAGARTVGMDRSGAMLREARRKAVGARVALGLVRGDVRAFGFGRRFELILCCYDSLNYLTGAGELEAALRCVREALANGGRFVCDLTTGYAYSGELEGVAHELDLGDLEYRWRTVRDGVSGLATTEVGVVAQRAGEVLRCTERHVQRPYAPEEVAGALRGAGLRLLAMYGVGGDGLPTLAQPEPDAPRVVYVASRGD